jgi:M6 family metalloprotease-like protein
VGFSCFLAGWGLLAVAPAAQQKTAAPPDLSAYRTVDKAVTAKVGPSRAGRGGQTGYLGVSVERDPRGRLVVEEVQPDSPAAKAGLKKGDVVTRVGDQPVRTAQVFREWVQTHGPGASVKLGLLREEKPVEVTAILVATSRPMTLGSTERGGRGNRGGAPTEVWKKDVFRLAVVCIEYPDVKHNAKVPTKEWEEAFFSRGRHARKTNATGQPVHGSLNDYFVEQSVGVFRLEGKVFDWVEVGKKRSEYVQGSGTSNKTALLVEALDKVTARDGKDAFKDCDGFLFLYAGARVQTNRGALYYPHAGTVSYQSNRRPYLLQAEGGSRMSSIEGFAKPMGQVLGLPDLAARSENAGSEGLGVWCAMSNPLGNGRPQHLCAWSKEKLGWLKPTVIDPTVKQKLILAPVEDSPKECFKVLVRPDGSEYFLLENRRKKGFDADLPAEGLLIWRVVNGRPILEESHGVEGPSGPLVHLSAVPYPSPANSAFTPDTTPSSRSPLGGGLPVHVTEVRRLSDGRITFHIGYEYR